MEQHSRVCGAQSDHAGVERLDPSVPLTPVLGLENVGSLAAKKTEGNQDPGQKRPAPTRLEPGQMELFTNRR